VPYGFEPTIVPSSAGQWLAILGLGLGPVGLAFYIWDYGVKHGDIDCLGPPLTQPVLSTLILVAAGVSPATPALALASALIVAGAVVASRKG
jgi:drug/metabolite transporter (DMT)-like permease